MIKGLTEMSEREYFANVRARLPMYVMGGRLDRFEAFLDGYDQHARRHGGPGLEGWTDWLVAKHGQTCSHGWSGQVRHIALPEGWDRWDLPPHQEQLVIDALFELLDGYLAERDTDPTH
ncbi:hypothetical protein ACFXJ8_07245 [Nonomuraea sp. NPDC059194]|uniref:hypothetical protein n=1 Tax=Nonomuraea sp. NPDC059194 TaxID=3346764 RepID=UPI0036785A8A